MSNPTRVLWLDLESTGSDPYGGDVPLELGAIVTDWTPELNVIARASMVIRPPGSPHDHALLWARMVEPVKAMHTSSGLWTEATAGEDAWQLDDADTAVAQWLAGHTDDGLVPVAGSGVGHLDLPFIKVWFPRLAQRITYWPLDIGNVRRLLELAGRPDLVDMPGDVDAKPHRALGDVELHVAEARRYLQLLRRIPATGAKVSPEPRPFAPSFDAAPPAELVAELEQAEVMPDAELLDEDVSVQTLGAHFHHEPGNPTARVCAFHHRLGRYVFLDTEGRSYACALTHVANPPAPAQDIVG